MTITALDENGNALDTVALSGSAPGPAGDLEFVQLGRPASGAGRSPPISSTDRWNNPLVFKQMSLQIVGASQAGLVDRQPLRQIPTAQLYRGPH
jgi:hypothetical protein